VSNATGTGRSWPQILDANAKALADAPSPRCQYHVGVSMVRVPHGFHCPVIGCFAVSGVAIESDEENSVD
jgi:hypothetical protein